MPARRSTPRRPKRPAIPGADGVKRCGWCGNDPVYVAYHDEEWGVAVHDDRTLFEFLLLEGAQAGLAWITILRKREGYREAFADFDPAKVARFTPARERKLLANPEIVRNRLKVRGAVKGARAFLEVQKEWGTFAEYLWSHVDGKPVVSRFRGLDEVPAKTELSDRISKDLKRRGFTFVGSTIVYAYLQAVGVVNDHLVGCAYRSGPRARRS